MNLATARGPTVQTQELNRLRSMADAPALHSKEQRKSQCGMNLATTFGSTVHTHEPKCLGFTRTIQQHITFSVLSICAIEMKCSNGGSYSIQIDLSSNGGLYNENRKQHFWLTGAYTHGTNSLSKAALTV
jgi:spore coat protein U-like protein